ncbi:MAG TPA: hypothetical protein GX505_13345 [Clostridiales bacterium]|nr:hypothetical protein [Clostridiales bacterium]
MMNWRDITTIRKMHRSGMCNGGWAYDAYPWLEKLDAGKSITIAEIEGPGVITSIHTTQHFIFEGRELSKEPAESTECTRYYTGNLL